MNNRLQLIAALIFGVCVVFFAALLSAPHLDTLLQVAVIAFVMALPFLVLDYMFASWKLKPGLSKLDEWFSEGIQWAAWLIGDGFGVLAVAVGIGAVVWHLSEAAFWLGLATLGVGCVRFLAVALVYAGRRAVREYDKRQQQQVEGSAATTTEHS